MSCKSGARFFGVNELTRGMTTHVNLLLVISDRYPQLRDRNPEISQVPEGMTLESTTEKPSDLSQIPKNPPAMEEQP
jgi:hypothetical protein